MKHHDTVKDVNGLDAAECVAQPILALDALHCWFW